MPCEQALRDFSDGVMGRLTADLVLQNVVATLSISARVAELGPSKASFRQSGFLGTKVAP